MRQLKFRAYQKYHEKLVPVKNIEWKDGELYSITLDYGNTCIPRIVTYSDAFGDYWLNDENGSVLEISQFTGLHDKNGTPVYEGDIIEAGLQTGEVYFEKGCYYIKWKETEMLDHLGSYTSYLNKAYYVSTVIGNKFENPELLEQTT